jgi:hypothetical protein
MLDRELERIRASTAKWTKAEKNLPRRLLDARRVATELEGVMEKIQQTNELFIVRSLHYRNRTALLILLSVGEHRDDGEESRGHPRGCQSHQKGYGGRQGTLSSTICTNLIAHHDNGRIKVRTTGFRFAGWLISFT